MLRLRFAPAWLVVALIVMAQAGCQGGGVRILSSSMEPTLHCAKPGPGCESKTADYVRQVPDTTLERGDIIAFKVSPRTPAKCGSPKGTVLIFVKRLIGLPGERWSISKGFVYINGRRLREPYVPLDERDRFSLPGGRVPKGKYFVLGDNRIISCDSRIWGYVPQRNVIAHVVAIERGSRTINLR
jgi:signal peptidase I